MLFRKFLPGMIATVTLLVLFSLSLPHVGANFSNKSFLIKLESNGTHVVEAVRKYAAAHGGKFPEKLDDLTKEGLIESSELNRLLSSVWANEPGPLGWIYLPPAEAGKSSPAPVLFTPVIVDTSGKLTRWYHDFRNLPEAKPRIPTRVVIFADGFGTAMHEDDFQSLLKERKITLTSPAQ